MLTRAQRVWATLTAMMPRGTDRRGPAVEPGRRDPRMPRRQPGELGTTDFLRGLLEATRAALPVELQSLQARQQWALVKFFADDPAVHFEMWLHRARGRVELGLHFETRDAVRNQRLLEYVADELPFLKAVLGDSLEAEPWDKGWTRVYLTRPLARLGPEEQARLATTFAELIETLEPIRREAVEAVGPTAPAAAPTRG